MKMKSGFLSIYLFGLLALPSLAVTISDNFNDGDAAGWTPLSPLSAFGAGGAYSFPSGGYQILAPTSPSPGSLGPARAGSLRTDISHSQFETQVDVTDWDATKPNMVVGFSPESQHRA
jgi:hypothetical protein